VSFKGFYVLEQRQAGVSRLDDATEKFYRVGPQGGTSTIDPIVTHPMMLRDYDWPITSNADAKAIRDFVDLVDGSAVPFWMIGQERDLTMNTTLAVSSDNFKIAFCGYAASIFPQGPGRRYLNLRRTTDQIEEMFEVISAVDNADGTETITLQSPAGNQFDPATTVISYLRFCRLEDDEVTMDFAGVGVGVGRFRFREIAREAP